MVLLSVSFIAVGCVVKRRDISKEDSDNDIEIPLIPPIRVPSTDSETDKINISENVSWNPMSASHAAPALEKRKQEKRKKEKIERKK